MGKQCFPIVRLGFGLAVRRIPGSRCTSTHGRSRGVQPAAEFARPPRALYRSYLYAPYRYPSCKGWLAKAGWHRRAW